MRLLHTRGLWFKNFIGQPPEYVILSHRWQDEEATFEHFSKGTARSLKGYQKILGTCELAARDGYDWVWIDSCCIDKSSSSELQEAINSMFEWYKNANISDGAEGWTHKFRDSKWFTRGWTLQELIAPRSVEFYTNDWANIGTKLTRIIEISNVTGIPADVLIYGEFWTHSAAERLSWAAHRQVSRVEDSTYCLLGLFQVNMPLLYGEGGGNAFQRLQQEIFRRSMDHTLFLFARYDSSGDIPLLAASVEQFCQIERCTVCRGCWTEVFPHGISYQSLAAFPLQPYTRLFGPGQAHQELSLSNEGVLVPLRLVAIDKNEEPSARAELPQDSDDRYHSEAAVLRVRDREGRWLCLGIDHFQAAVSLVRNRRIYFFSSPELPGKINEELYFVHNMSRLPSTRLRRFQFDFVSEEFDVIHWHTRWPKRKQQEEEAREGRGKGKKKEEDPGEGAALVSPGSHFTSEQILVRADNARYYNPGDKELMLYVKSKDPAGSAALLFIRNLVQGTTPWVGALCLGASSVHIISTPDHTVHHAFKSDRCMVKLLDGGRAGIALRQKPSLVVGDSQTRRYEITMRVLRDPL